jgi:cytochrome c peroxidase
LGHLTQCRELGRAEIGRINAPSRTDLPRETDRPGALSLRGNQSCATCHNRDAGWTGDLSHVNAGPAIYEGSVHGLFSSRKPPTVAYAMAPVLHIVVEDSETLFVGGHFWDGRATGATLGDPIAEQAQGPFVNPVEQALPDPGCVVRRVCSGQYQLSSIRQERGVPDAQEMIRLLVAGHETVARTARQVFTVAEDASDQPTCDLLTQRMQVHEKTAWMLRSLLE